ncbi:hypothetical protein T05_2798 [Trichinella murrelli]|uniref:Uncharacterized protein n=1 Tax=Trichinella murrelli TaxID=144512 RepID=A0A0V0T7Y8_9BILA|nr:hypothetical protein T05_2798 [Trichinella murrelli]
MDFSEETMQCIHRETLTEDGSPPSEDIRFTLNLTGFAVVAKCLKLMLNMALRLKIAKSGSSTLSMHASQFSASIS